MPVPPPESGFHVVATGEWVGSIAIRYGYASWEEDVWKHSSNSALRDKREDPHVLLEGDELHIPPFEPKQETCATGKKHTFELKVPTETLRLRFLDDKGEPLKDADYTLEVEFDASGGNFKQQNNKLNSDGVLEEQIPSTATRGVLKIPSLDQVFELALGHLNPMTDPDDGNTVQGIKQRMKSLGYFDGEIDEEKTPEFEAALASIQKQGAGLNEEGKDIPKPDNTDGKLTKETIKFIHKFFGC